MSSINSTVAIQLQKSKQQLQELNQKLLTGYQRLNELHKHPNQEDNIAQLNSQLKLGVQQRQRLQQIIQQMNLQIQRQQPSVTQSPNATVQVLHSNIDYCAYTVEFVYTCTRKTLKFVPRSAKRGLPLTSNLQTVIIHNLRLKNVIDLKSGQQ